MDPEHAWQDLVAAALLGTDRRAFSPPSADGPLGRVLGGLEGRDPEKALLGTSAALFLFRRAGRLPDLDPSTATVEAEADSRPRCSAGSDGHLALMLSGTYAEVLAQWLEGLVEAGKQPSPERVPELLEIGRSQPALWPLVTRAVGPLGAWLARQNPEWAYASESGAASDTLDDPAIETLWQTGTTLQRATLLRRIRESDPPKGRGLAASTWETDGPEARASFLEALGVGLSLEDQAFLEARLDDRRKEVRTRTAGLLARLPESDLVARMVGRVAPLLGFSEAATGAILEGFRDESRTDRPDPPDPPFRTIHLPEACDKSMIRDGIEPKPARNGVGEKAWWLSRMIARIPPRAWSAAWGLSPSSLAEAVLKSPWKEAVYEGLVEAMVRYGDPEWMSALLPHRRAAGGTIDLLSMLDELPPKVRESSILRLVQTSELQGDFFDQAPALSEEQVTLMTQLPAPWSDELARLVLDRLPGNLADKTHFRYSLIPLIKVAARALPTDLARASPLQGPAEGSNLDGYWRQALLTEIEAFHVLIQFRHEMIQELRA